MKSHLQSIEADRWQQLFKLVPQMIATQEHVRWTEGMKISEGVFVAPNPINDDVVMAFFDAVFDLELTPVFEYSEWMPEFNQLLNSAEDLNDLDLLTICKCFTVIDRGEHFCDGYAANCIKRGFVPKLISILESKVKLEFNSSENTPSTPELKDMKTQQQQQFLERCIFDQKKFEEIAQEMNLPPKTVSQWYVDLKDEREKMAGVRKIWLRKNKPGELKAFYNWYLSHERKCVYCGVTEDQLQKMISDKIIFSKRLDTRGKTLEMERMASEESYENWDNITMSCYWCNNAKTDTFTHEEFKEVGKVIGAIWKKRLEQQ